MHFYSVSAAPPPEAALEPPFCILWGVLSRTDGPKSPGYDHHKRSHDQQKKSAHKEKEGTMDASLKPGAQGPHPTAANMRAFYRSEAWVDWIGRLCALRHEIRLHSLEDEWEQECLRQQRLALKGGRT